MDKHKAGHALKALLSKDLAISEDDLKKSSSSPLANKTRREILEYLCRCPASCFTRISTYLDISAPTTKWHLDKLVESKYIKKGRLGNLAVFYPDDFLFEGDLEFFGLLNDDKIRKIYGLIIMTPGLKQNELGNLIGCDQQTGARVGRKLEQNKFVLSVQDGKYRRYFSTNLLESSKKSSDKKMKLFKTHLLSHMDEDGLKPKLLSSRNERFIVSIRILNERYTLTLSTNPYETILNTLNN